MNTNLKQDFMEEFKGKLFCEEYNPDWVKKGEDKWVWIPMEEKVWNWIEEHFTPLKVDGKEFGYINRTRELLEVMKNDGV